MTILALTSRCALVLALGVAIDPASARADCWPDDVYQRAFDLSLRGGATNATDKQADPPTATGASAALVDSPQQTKLIAAALQQGLVKRNDAGAFTISIAPFAWISAASRPEKMDPQEIYDRYNNARRLTGSFTLGGKGDAIDSDGDGKPEDPADAKNLTDSFAIELQYRFLGSRDRRDYAIPDDLRDSAKEFINAMSAKATDISEMVIAPFRRMKDDAKLDEASCQTLVRQVSLHPGFAKLLQAYSGLSRRIEQQERNIDTSWVWSVAATAVERKSYLGPDKYSIALRGLKGIEAQSYHKFNLELGRVNSLAPGQPNIDTAKLAYEYSRPVLAGIDLGGGQPTFSAALFAERYRNAPSPAPSSVATLGVKWVFPISKGISVPLSISWANHTALLSDKDEVVGHVGINLDLDQLSKL